MKKLFFLLISLLCSGCQNSQHDMSNDQGKKSQIIYDLDESTQIIMQLIKENSLKEILADTDPQQIATLLKNFSPSEMAMEAEVLNYQGVAAVIFYKEDADWQALHKKLEELAKKHQDIKFVQVNAEELFKVTQNAQIEDFPAIVFIKDRKEIERIEPIGDELMQKIENTINLMSR